MAWRCGSLSRTLISTSRATLVRSSVRHLSHSAPPLGPRIPSRRFLFSLPKATGALGCAQSLMPLNSIGAATRLTSHIAVEARARCELSRVLKFTGDALFDGVRGSSFGIVLKESYKLFYL